MSVVYIGRPPGSTIDGTGTCGEDVMKASVYNKTTQNLWLRRIGAHRGISAGASSMDYRYVAYLGTSAHEPDTRIGMVGLKTTTATMSFAGDGADADHALDVVDQGPAGASCAQIWSNSYVSFALEQDTAGTLMFGMKVAAGLTADEKRIFVKTSVATPPDPFGSFSSSTEGHMSMWGECDTNEAPEVPDNKEADTASGDLTPTLEADFRDKNGTYGPGNGGQDNGDIVSRVHIQFRRKSDLTMFWDFAYDATASEQNNDRTSRLYAGTTLVRGTAYEWRIRHRDQFNAWGTWAAWLDYTPPSTGTGSVTINSGHTPVGKQDAINGFTFQFIWNHNTSLSTNGIKSRFKNNGVIVAENGAWKADTTAAGATGTITFAELGFADLAWGGNYTVALKGRDTNNVESNWSNEHPFTTDKAPTVPSGLNPSGGLMFTGGAYPKLRAQWSDADDTTGTGLTGTFAITRPNATTVNVTPTLNGSWWEFQTTATEITVVGTYTWRARSFDGTLYSGETTSSGSADWSNSATFQYQSSGPAVTITAPTSDGTILTATPTVTWTQSNQAQYRVWIAPKGTVQAIYDTGFIVDGSTTSHVVTGGILALGKSYDFYVSLKDGSAVQTDAAVYNVNLAYIAPSDVGGFIAQPIAVYTDPAPTAVRLEWEQSSEADNVFKAYDIYRDGVLIIRVTSKAVLAAIDPRPLSGVEHIYTIKTVTYNTNGSEISSVGVDAPASLVLPGYVLASVANPLTNRAVLTRVDEDRSRIIVPGQTYTPWGAITDPNTAPTTVFGKARYRAATLVGRLDKDAAAEGDQRYAELVALIVSGETFSLRDDIGHEWFMIKPPEEEPSFNRQRLGKWEFELPLRQEQFTVGVVVAS